MKLHYDYSLTFASCCHAFPFRTATDSIQVKLKMKRSRVNDFSTYTVYLWLLFRNSLCSLGVDPGLKQ